MARGRLSMTLIAALAICGCDRVVFQHGHAGDAAVHDASTPATCAKAQDGSPCDDNDVCTPASSCRAGRCVAGNAFDDCTVADSVEGFSGEQGKNGWFYGFWDADADADGSYDSASDFKQMAFCGPNDSAWRPPGVCGLTRNDPGWRWTENLGFGLQHPETKPHLELPIRRWVSAGAGPARVHAHHHSDGTASDGTRALLLLDGEEIWRNDAQGGDPVGTERDLDIQLRAGSVVEQLLHPLKGSADDTTYFGIVITGR